MATLSIVLVPAKVLKNGKHKIRIALAHNGETRYIITSVVVDSEKEFRNGAVVRRPDAAMLNKKLRSIIQEYQDRMDEIPYCQSLSCAEIVAMIKNAAERPKSINDIFDEMILNPRIKDTSRETYKFQWSVLSKIVGNKLPDHINYATIQLVERELTNRGIKPTTMRVYMTTLRMVLNYAMKCEYVHYTVSPFAKYVMPKAAIRDNWLSPEQIAMIRDAEVKRKGQRFVKDLFMLSYYLGGINAIDIFKINFNNVRRTLTYTRSKIEARSEDTIATFEIPDVALELINRIKSEDGKIIPPSNPPTYINQISYVVANMKALSKTLGIPNLMFYSARKSFSQHAFDLGVAPQVIDYILGHSQRKSGSCLYHYIHVTPEMATDAIRKVLDNLDKQN